MRTGTSSLVCTTRGSTDARWSPALPAGVRGRWGTTGAHSRCGTARGGIVLLEVLISVALLVFGLSVVGLRVT
ncbi:MAG: hypothetical protein HY718_07690, partial [Planctomycetes bacterium]|nr:hypothetical protein [Planctomycetota bacterium]